MHSSESAALDFPQCLKGSDLVLYSVFESLGIKTYILPVLGAHGRYTESNPSLSIKGYTSEYPNDPKPPSAKRCRTHPMWLQLEECRRSGKKIDFEFDDNDTVNFHVCGDVEARWKVLAMVRQVRKLADFAELARSEGLDTSGMSYRQEGAQIGTALWPCMTFVEQDWTMEEVSEIPLLSFIPTRTELTGGVLDIASELFLPIVSIARSHLAYRAKTCGGSIHDYRMERESPRDSPARQMHSYACLCSSLPQTEQGLHP